MSKQAWLLLVACAAISASAAVAGDEPIPAAPPPDPWRPPSIVTVQGNMGVGSLYPSGLNWWSGGILGRPQALLLRDGDLIGFRERSDTWLSYRAGDGCDLEVAFPEFGVQLWGTTTCAFLDTRAGVDWVSEASDSQLADLRMIRLGDDLDEAALAAVDLVAAANPRVDLVVRSPLVLDKALARIAPRAIVGLDGSSTEPETWELLAKQSKLETLVIEGPGVGVKEALTKLPMLSRLFLINWSAEKFGPLPSGLGALRSLTVMGSVGELADLGELPPTLGELSLIGVSWRTDLKGLEKLTGLHTLVLSGQDCSDLDLESLTTLKRLRWLGLPTDASAAQLMAVACAHPGLAVLELASDGDPLLDLGPLRDLEELHALTLVSESSGEPVLENLEAIHGLTSLAFVALSDQLSSETGPGPNIADLRRALPDAMLVTVDPKCLGSGWILALLPAILLAWMRARRQHARPQAS